MYLTVNQNENPCDRDYVWFHSYKVFRCGRIENKYGSVMKMQERKRENRDKTDLTVRLSYEGKVKKWTLQRLVAACFLGPIDGYQINHKNRDTHNCHADNLERVTASENASHWRKHKATIEGNKNEK